MPDWKDFHPKELSNKTSVAVTDLDSFDVKVLMKDISENHDCGFLSLMMRRSRGRLGDLNAESFAECINHASKIVMNEGSCSVGHDALNKIMTL